ncbi:hypothetical protein [Blastococcus brunescens]|uniref:Intradiol ring-cleavage dioxygenases domain-containing protein n=1 Tax=Blastococcus brunescens TaxID=1564165 RepID=A0ABZ1B896_9ACTN|nr:hypothetical protein [Blastococcus sp. BMG 8361]WRL67020.1 hypothetical protein U6N30_15900 [Blastococcus sp. BMG 8361]
MDGGGAVADRHGPDQQREARGVHPRLRRPRPLDARRPDEPPAGPGRHAGDGARPIPHRGLPGAGVRRGHVAGPRRRAALPARHRARPGRRPRAGAVLDVWQADDEGVYEAQLGEVDEARLRAKYAAREDARYCVRTIAPKGYTIPMDGPVGDLVSRTEISHFRPAHIHVLINEPGFEPLITHLFQEGAEYLDSDVVFGTKQELVVRFDEREPGPTPDGGTSDVPWLEARYDFVLQRQA